MKCNQTLKNNLWYKIPVESKSLEFYKENFNYFFGWGFPILIYDVRISWTLIYRFFVGVSQMSSRDTSKTWFFLRIIDLLLSFFKYIFWISYSLPHLILRVWVLTKNKINPPKLKKTKQWRTKILLFDFIKENAFVRQNNERWTNKWISS